MYETIIIIIICLSLRRVTDVGYGTYTVKLKAGSLIQYPIGLYPCVYMIGLCVYSKRQRLLLFIKQVTYI